MVLSKMLFKNTAAKSLIISIMIISLAVTFAGCDNSGVTGKATSSLGCSMEVNTRVLEIDGIEKVCASENLVELTLENLGTDLEGYSIGVSTSIEPFTYDVEKKITRGAISRILIPYDKASQGEVQKLVITPLYKSIDSENIVLCNSRQVIVEAVDACSE